MHDEPRERPDDLDRLYARLEEAAPPPDLARRVLAQTATVEQLSPWRARLALLAYLLALTALGVVAYQIGQGVTANGAADLLQLLVNEPELLADAPGGLVAGIAALLPWQELAAALALAALALAAVALAGKDWARREDLGIQ